MLMIVGRGSKLVSLPVNQIEKNGSAKKIGFGISTPKSDEIGRSDVPAEHGRLAFSNAIPGIWADVRFRI
jgi:hypothetical protein